MTTKGQLNPGDEASKKFQEKWAEVPENEKLVLMRKKIDFFSNPDYIVDTISTGYQAIKETSGEITEKRLFHDQCL